MDLPPIVLQSRYWLGDAVLMESIADRLAEDFDDVYVCSNYPEIFEAHPRVKAIALSDRLPEDSRVIDLSKSICSAFDEEAGKIIVPEKYQRMYEEAGLSESEMKGSKLYLGPEEQEAVADIRGEFWGKAVCMVMGSNNPVKQWPYMSRFIELLVKDDIHIFILAKEEIAEYEELKQHRVIPLFDMSLREMMQWLAAMDLVIGVDTGPMHVAGALGSKSLVLGMDCCRELFRFYESATFWPCPVHEQGMKCISPRKIRRAVRRSLESPPKPESYVPEPAIRAHKAHGGIALFRLDGLGGTATLTDHARKIYEMTGEQSTLIVRGYKDIFAENPYVADTIEVGHVKWGECLKEMLPKFDALGEIRFSPGKWHQGENKIFEQDFAELEGLFNEFPIGFAAFEIHGLHHVQLTDKILGLPYDTIDMEIFNYGEPPADLPANYVVLNNGVDVQHAGMRQTKSWHRWDELTDMLDIPWVQVGTTNDVPIKNAMDLRGKTKLPTLCTILHDAAAVVCTEGGIMHVSYACNSPNVLVMRGPTRGKLFEYPGQRMIDSPVCDLHVMGQRQEYCWWSTEDWFLACPLGIDAACMKSITPQRVAYNLEEVLNEDMA